MASQAVEARVTGPTRLDLVDSLRGFALFGIFIMNISGFSLYLLLSWGGQWLFGVEGLSNDALFEVYANGSLVDFLKLQSTSLFYRPAFLLSSSRLQRVLAMFLVGLWVGRRGILKHPASHRGLLGRVVIWGLPIALVANVPLALGEMSPGTVFGGEHMAHCGVRHRRGSALEAYTAGIALLWLRPASQRWLSRLAPAGRMALTNYLAQSAISVFLFYGIGLGWGGKVGPTWWFAIVAVTVGLQVVVSAWWLRRFRFGPLEWLWRSLTYGRIQSMRVPAAVPSGLIAT